jgi:hypothetical protein
VICSLPATAGDGDIICWVELSLENPTQPSVVCSVRVLQPVPEGGVLWTSKLGARTGAAGD